MKLEAPMAFLAASLSGHIVCLNIVTTGDGIITALQGSCCFATRTSDIGRGVGDKTDPQVSSECE